MQASEERWQHWGDGRAADEVAANRVLLPVEERVSADAAVAGRLQSATVCLSVDIKPADIPAAIASSAPAATLESSPHSIITANGGGDKCLML